MVAAALSISEMAAPPSTTRPLVQFRSSLVCCYCSSIPPPSNRNRNRNGIIRKRTNVSNWDLFIMSSSSIPIRPPHDLLFFPAAAAAAACYPPEREQAAVIPDLLQEDEEEEAGMKEADASSSSSSRETMMSQLESDLIIRRSGMVQGASRWGGPVAAAKAALINAEANLFSLGRHVGRYIVTMMSTGAILAVGFQLSGGNPQMNTLIWYSWLGGIVIGTMVGANMVLEEHSKAGPRTVVVTGSTRGLGKALAREFLLSGDRVVIASRSSESVQLTVQELQENLKAGILSSKGVSSKTNLEHAKVIGTACDVCKVEDVERLADFAKSEFGPIDIWINNAGVNKGFRPLLDHSDEDISQIVSTNLVGSLICTREALRVMGSQQKGGHIFNMDGAGSGGSSTPLTAVYGSTKCGLRQLQSSLLKESKRSKVGVHTASPGMVLTDLLLSGSSLQNKKMFNIICELPETVARTLVPRMRIVKGTGKAINYLTPPRILLALVTAWLRRRRWFDSEGRAVYAAEADRVRNWAESRAQFSFTDAMEMYTENTWVSVFSLSVVCAFIILSSSASTTPGT